MVLRSKYRFRFCGSHYISKFLSLITLISHNQDQPVFTNIKTIIGGYFKMTDTLTGYERIG